MCPLQKGYVQSDISQNLATSLTPRSRAAAIGGSQRHIRRLVVRTLSALQDPYTIQSLFDEQTKQEGKKSLVLEFLLLGL